MRCPNCATINPPEEQLTYCKKCGAELRTVCPRCHADNASDAEHCSDCGLELHPDRGHERAAGIRVDGDTSIIAGVMKKRPTLSSGVLAAAAGVLILVWIPVFVTLKNRAKLNGCQSNLKQLAMAMQVYAKDNGGHAPTAFAWSESLLPYLKDRNAMTCPARPGTIGYAFNLNLNETPLAQVNNSGALIAFFESDNAKAMSGTQALWLQKVAHSKGNNVAFIDGTVRQSRTVPADHFWQTKVSTPVISTPPSVPEQAATTPQAAPPLPGATAGTPSGTPPSPPIGAPTGAPAGSPIGSPTESSTGSPAGSPDSSGPIVPAPGVNPPPPTP